MAVNRYPGQCHVCEQRVPAGEGTRARSDSDDRWIVYHQHCIPAPRAPEPGDHDGWHRRPLAAFDVESTGVRHSVDRIVSASVRDTAGQSMELLIDPGVEIPAGATATHGITTEQARASGRQPAEALGELADTLAAYLRAGTPIVIYNAVYDLTLLESELLRHGLPSLLARAGRIEPLIIDPLVLDRHVDRYRKGGRTLEVVCAHYGVTHPGPHRADADTQACLDLAIAIARRYPEVARMNLADLFARQAAAHAEQAAYWASRGRDADPAWPVGAIAAEVWPG
ncbi:exonuclease domain-containing protein [Longispora albida]|uniref:exonuclease domain-containing protein n=1 Tax=Longispora albida TaxID=203523 RepID=UPI0003778F16|nr:exonuclease domain-containing protein [Longispora albida]